MTIADQEPQRAVLGDAEALEVEVFNDGPIERFGLIQAQRLEDDRFRKRARRVVRLLRLRAPAQLSSTH